MTKPMVDLEAVGKAVTAFVEGELVYDAEHKEYFLYSKRRDAFRVLHGKKYLRSGTPEEYRALSAGELQPVRPVGEKPRRNEAWGVEDTRHKTQV